MFIKRIRPSVNELAPVIIDGLNSGKDVKITVTGNSMFPLFRSNKDAVVLTKSDNFKKYDIVLYKRKTGQYVLHRIIKIKNDALIIAGDNEIKKERGITKNDCIAKVKSFTKNSKDYSVDNAFYKFYSKLWALVFPFRHIIIKILRGILKVLRFFHLVKR